VTSDSDTNAIAATTPFNGRNRCLIWNLLGFFVLGTENCSTFLSTEGNVFVTIANLEDAKVLLRRAGAVLVSTPELLFVSTEERQTEAAAAIGLTGKHTA
jgi:hypothetical protein